MREMTENERKNRDELLRLMNENPDLLVVPMVDAEIPEDDVGYWVAALGDARVDEYLLASDCVLFKSDDDIFDALERYLPYEEFLKLPEEESACRPYYDALPWEKAIIVYAERRSC